MKLSKTKKNFLRKIGNKLLGIIIDVLCKTLKIKTENRDVIKNLENSGRNFIVAFWHGNMIVPWFIHRKTKIAAVVSDSPDGELLANILKKWKYKLIRGSSNKGGGDVLKLMTQLIKDGFSVAITPDGPTGPLHKMKAGAVVTAKKSGRPLILMGIAYNKKFVLNSWDKFEIPKPFSKVTVIYSKPVIISPDTNYQETSELIIELEKKLNNLKTEAEKICSSY
jgi:lysophospholipid acyltransferase (LPLAT)-like uncharacterized protein